MQHTNDTSSRFLGSVRRSWLNPGNTSASATTGGGSPMSGPRSTSRPVNLSDAQNIATSPTVRTAHPSDSHPLNVALNSGTDTGIASTSQPAIAVERPSGVEPPDVTPVRAGGHSITYMKTNAPHRLNTTFSNHIPTASPHLTRTPDLQNSMHVAFSQNVAVPGTSQATSLPFSPVSSTSSIVNGSSSSTRTNRIFQTPSTSIAASPMLTVPSSRSGSIQTPVIGGGTARQYVAGFDADMEKLRASCILGPVGENRLGWIRNALLSNDVFFLLLHQSYCLWFLQRNLLSFKMLGFTEAQNSGFVQLGTLLGTNSQIPRELVEYGCDFITSASTLQHDRTVRSWLSLVIRFLTNFPQRWDDLLKTCQSRGIPPCAHVICQQLTCIPTSITWQCLCFIAIQIRLHNNSPTAFLVETSALFTQDHSTFMENIARTVQRPGDQLDQTALERFELQYKQIARKHISLVEHSPADGRPLCTPASTVLRYPEPSSASCTDNILTAVSPVTAPPGYAFVSASHRVGAGLYPAFPRLLSSPPIQGTVTALPHAGGSTQVASPLSRSRVDLNNPSLAQGGHVIHPVPLLPPATFRLPVLHEPNPALHALHQAHLWLPRHRSKEASGLQYWFTFLDSFLLEPQIHLIPNAYATWNFDLPADLEKRIVKIASPDGTDIFYQPQADLEDGAIQVRLKCVKIASGIEIPTSWSTLAAYWPECAFFSVNDQFVEVRRKLHYKRDLASDITQMLRAGTNKLEVSYHELDAKVDKSFGIAVEVIIVSSLATVITAPVELDAEKVLRSIVQTLNVGNGDDDIQLVDDFISIDLTDPFTSQIFSKPVRGSSCLHRECFDSDSFLQSQRMQAENGVVSPDKWLCPICGRDARPKNLVVDGFLVNVRKKLFEDGHTDVRAIHVMADGSWKPKAEQVSTASADGVIGPEQSQTDAGTFLVFSGQKRS